MVTSSKGGKEPFYITTTLPYVNAEPHMGHALEFVRADIIARFKESLGYEVFFNTGTDEHGQKLVESAQKAGVDIKKFVDDNALYFKSLLPKLGIKEDIHFIRTTDSSHEKSAQEFWKLVKERGYIYKKNYKAKYCVECEENKADSELVDDRCSIHTNREIEIREEENYFFKFSEFGDQLLGLYDKAESEGRSFVVPSFRLNEMREFIKGGLEDFSISRLKTKMSWGIPVPDDEDHVIYVWFDALINYISTLGWPEDKENFEKFWTNGTPVQYCGKDNTRFQSVMWQAMLLAAGLPNSHTIVVNGFITGDGGVKMSKSLGNVVNPMDIVSQYGTDALRYFLAREISSFEDSPFTLERFKESYNSGLANGLGNLVARTVKMAVSYDAFPDVSPSDYLIEHSYAGKYLEKFEIKGAMDEIWNRIAGIDKLIQEQKPFQEIKNNREKAVKDVKHYINEVYRIAWELAPFMPETSRKILSSLEKKESPENLFPRKD